MDDEKNQCISCGRHVFERSNFCKKCLKEQYDLFRVRSTTVRACKSCGLYEVEKNKSWRKFKNDKDVALFVAKKSIKAAGDIKKCDFNVHGNGNRYFVEITCTGAIDLPGAKLLKTEKREVVVVFKKLKCDICSKLSGNYHEAVIQLRGSNKDLLLKYIYKLADERDIVRVDTKKTGHDILIMFKRNARQISNKLKKQKISKSVKKSYKLKCQKKGKKLYRDYYAIR